MKFLIFNAAVVAALGFILIDQNYLDRRVLDDLRGGASSLVEAVRDPAGVPNPSTPVSVDRMESRPAATVGEVAKADGPNPTQPSAERKEADAVIALPSAAPVPVVIEEALASPATVLEDVPAEVAERRAEVLSPPAAGASDFQVPAANGSDRRIRLQALADELEAMSVDMIYQ